VTLLSHGYDGAWLTLRANDQLELIAARRKLTLSHSRSSHQVNSVISRSLAGFIDLLARSKRNYKAKLVAARRSRSASGAFHTQET
jgi:hypothetical protein